MNDQHLLYLEVQARELMSACQEIETIFATGADLLARAADARRLQTFATSFAKQLYEEEYRETVERRHSNEDEIFRKGSEFMVNTIGPVFIGKDRTKVASGNLRTRHSGRKLYLGTIVIRVGDGGLPDDVTILTVSRLARTQNREEFEVIRELQRQSGLLFSPDAFRRMIGILINDGRTGKLRLPISLKQLPAKWAIPRKVTVGFPVSVQPTATRLYQIAVVPRFPLGKDTSTQI